MNTELTVDKMKEQFRQYVIKLYQDVPTEVYEGLLSIFCIGVVGLLVFFGWKRGWKKIVGLLLAEYVFLIYSSTLIFRNYSESCGFEFTPFWSYDRTDLIAENIMNVVVFVPVGILLGLVNGSWLKVKSSWLIAIILGMSISVSIEVMQYLFHRGFAETDDVMHNTLGCILGYLLIKGSRLMVKGE